MNWKTQRIHPCKLFVDHSLKKKNNLALQKEPKVHVGIVLCKTDIYIYICVCVCVYVCVYIYIYIYILLSLYHNFIEVSNFYY
jgi:hypothetical protein